jgi:hypothetical protein
LSLHLINALIRLSAKLSVADRSLWRMDDSHVTHQKDFFLSSFSSSEVIVFLVESGCRLGFLVWFLRVFLRFAGWFGYFSSF